MSRDPWPPDSEESLARIATELADLNHLLKAYLKFALGTAVKAMRAAGPIPPEMEDIVKTLETWDA